MYCFFLAFHECGRILEIILTAKPDLLEARDSAGSTPLHESVKSLNFDITDYLLKKGANIKAVDNIGQNILHTAAAVGNITMIEYVLSRKILDKCSQAYSDITPLQIAEKCRQAEAVRVLSELVTNESS